MDSFESVKELVEGLGYKVELKNEGVQFYIKCKTGAINYYPKRDIWVDDKNKSHTNLNKMLVYLEANVATLRPDRKMPLREYICMWVFELAFIDKYYVEEYGFKTWTELFHYVVDNEIEELKTKRGCKPKIVRGYEHVSLPILLPDLYTEIEYLVVGVKTFNVKL